MSKDGYSISPVCKFYKTFWGVIYATVSICLMILTEVMPIVTKIIINKVSHLPVVAISQNFFGGNLCHCQHISCDFN
jgi:hypothetical protein